MEFVASSARRRVETSIPAVLERHIVIATVILFISYLAMGQSFTEIPMTNGIYFNPFLTLGFLLFGLYLVYISRQYFRMVAQKCNNGKPWGKQLLFYYCAILYLLSLAYFTSWIKSVGVMYMQCFLFLACISNIIIIIRMFRNSSERFRFFAICNIFICVLFIITSLSAFAGLIALLTGAFMYGGNLL